MTRIGHSFSVSSPAAGVLTAERGGDILEVKSVSAAYGPYRALFDVSFSVPAGAVVALIGSNGAGKSTVARTITGLVTATEGSVTLAGTDVTKLSAWRIARLGVAHVVEGRGVFSSLSVEENLVLVFRQRAGRRSVAANLARLRGLSHSRRTAEANRRNVVRRTAAPTVAGQGAGGAPEAVGGR